MDAAIEIRGFAQALEMVSKLKSRVSNTSASGMKRVVVPRRPLEGPMSLTGPVGLPRAYSWPQYWPSRADFDTQPLGEGVDDGHAHAVEAA